MFGYLPEHLVSHGTSSNREDVKASLDQEKLRLERKGEYVMGLLINKTFFHFLPIVSCLAFSFFVDCSIWPCIPSFVSNVDDNDSAGGARVFSNVLFIEVVVNFRHVVFEKDWLRFLPAFLTWTVRDIGRSSSNLFIGKDVVVVWRKWSEAKNNVPITVTYLRFTQGKYTMRKMFSSSSPQRRYQVLTTESPAPSPYNYTGTLRYPLDAFRVTVARSILKSQKDHYGAPS